MKKLFIISVAVFLFLCGGASARVSGGGSFTFVQISDPQLGFMEEPAGSVGRTGRMFDRAIDEINALKPAFVIMTGDMCDRPDDAAQYETYRKSIACLDGKIPLYTVPGNHDIVPPYSADALAAYKEKFGPEKFSFNYKGCAFIGFDSNCIKSGDVEAEARQYAWLRQQLAAAQGSRFIFVFCHCPVIWGAYDQPDDYSNFPAEYRYRYLDLFDEFHVTVVFAGHTHHPLTTQYRNTYYVICGSSGTTFENSPSGYNVVRVSRDDYDIKFTAIADQEK